MPRGMKTCCLFCLELRQRLTSMPQGTRAAPTANGIYGLGACDEGGAFCRDGYGGAYLDGTGAGDGGEGRTGGHEGGDGAVGDGGTGEGKDGGGNGGGDGTLPPGGNEGSPAPEDRIPGDRNGVVVSGGVTGRYLVRARVPARRPQRNTLLAFIFFLIGVWNWACVTLPAIIGLLLVYFPAMLWCIFFSFLRDVTIVAFGPFGHVFSAPFGYLHSLASRFLEHVLTPVFNGYWELFDYRLADLYAEWRELRASGDVIGVRELARKAGFGAGPLGFLDQIWAWLEGLGGYGRAAKGPPVPSRAGLVDKLPSVAGTPEGVPSLAGTSEGDTNSQNGGDIGDPEADANPQHGGNTGNQERPVTPRQPRSKPQQEADASSEHDTNSGPATASTDSHGPSARSQKAGTKSQEETSTNGTNHISESSSIYSSDQDPTTPPDGFNPKGTRTNS